MSDDSDMVMVPRGKLKAWADTLYDQAWSLNDRAVGDVSKEIEHILSASPVGKGGPDIEAIKKAAYQEGWNDRESDFLVGAARVSQPDVVRDCIERVADGSMSSDDALSTLFGRIDNDR